MGKVELGQGIGTALAQIAADELGVSFDSVRLVSVDTDFSPDEGFDRMETTGMATGHYWLQFIACQ